MKELIEFSDNIDEVLDILSDAESILSQMDQEFQSLELTNDDLRDALSRFAVARDAIKAIRDPLRGQIRAAIEIEDEASDWKGTSL